MNSYLKSAASLTGMQTTPQEVFRLAPENKILAEVVQGWQEGTWKTWEEAMTAAVCYLVHDAVAKGATEQE